MAPVGFDIALNLVANSSFKKHKTTVKPIEDSTALITAGISRLSTHPIYLDFVLTLLGITLLMGSLMPYSVVLLFSLFMNILFIRLEEKSLKRPLVRHDWNTKRRCDDGHRIGPLLL